MNTKKIWKVSVYLLFSFYFLIFQLGVSLAKNINAPYEWYRYQGASDSDDKKHNCGPTCVAMAIQFTRDNFVPIKDIRSYILAYILRLKYVVRQVSWKTRIL